MHNVFVKTIFGLLAVAALTIGLPPVKAASPMPILVIVPGLSGESAITALGGNIDAVAAHYDQTAVQLRALFRSDSSLRVDGAGYLYYVCVGIPQNTPAYTNIVSPLQPLTNTFFLHSKPGSTKTIYLDFNGETISGRAWNNNNTPTSGNDIIAPPWDINGNPGVFSANEQSIIQQVWYLVAEDYAPFDVDVTTEYPGEAAITRSDVTDNVFGTRALISPINSLIDTNAYGGLAYVGVYNLVGDFFKPALIFPENLGNNPKNIAEAVSHEVGHNLGLHHQGTSSLGYYAGQGNWAPIMGVGYYKPIVQWAKGEYQDANNHEDALALITTKGLDYRAQDFGNSIATASLMPGIKSITNGVISRTGEADYFYFQTGSGSAQVTITNWSGSSDLHERVTIYDFNGVPVVSSESVDDASVGTRGVTIQFPVTAGKYYVSIVGTNNGNAFTTGYSTYASLGQYTLAITNPLGSATTFTAPSGPWGTNLAVMNGSNPNGLWLLFVQDDAVLYTGIINNGWYVTLTTADLVGQASDNALYASKTNITMPYATNCSFTVCVTNYGPSTSSNVFVTDTLPTDGLVLVSSNSTAGTVSIIGSVLTWSVGTLQTNAGASLTLVLHSIVSGAFTNTATVSSTTADPNPDDDTVATAITVTAPPLPPLLTNFSLSGVTNDFQLTVNGDPNFLTIVQASTNLVNWVNLFTSTPPFIYTNFGTTNYPVRFYRAVVGP